ncbi:hypothetical protein PPROV_000645900 [Pycnococcus provasolii]|uniref:Uncharacterized protein n=1 Tax=Pycnococcus provasolii TaxID=41880 RepID=A0A830HRZ0_9CHLO|nr:hypothetical protein PPROV_000645900 [Pycnococcus provasolii]
MLAAFRVDLFVSLLNLKRVNTDTSEELAFAGWCFILNEHSPATSAEGARLLILKELKELILNRPRLPKELGCCSSSRSLRSSSSTGHVCRRSSAARLLLILKELKELILNPPRLPNSFLVYELRLKN